MDRAAGPDPRTSTSQLSSALSLMPEAVSKSEVTTDLLLILDAGKVNAVLVVCHEVTAKAVN
jgi:hypothetical protein